MVAKAGLSLFQRGATLALVRIGTRTEAPADRAVDPPSNYRSFFLKRAIRKR